ncbi:ABC transporter substrate-binding protein [Pokkaliibacter plantistimulans]|uniref:ABC transporter substrate-binding protein n=1 Tax=Pokkaliibacter plantistimulans TaxID=1635171 RepID=UPI000D742C74|nr:ABC transporter substrate-binding protein [Pokkaliibacter plantistimulans]
MPKQSYVSNPSRFSAVSQRLLPGLCGAALVLAGSSLLSTAVAAEPVKLGMITTLSTKGGYLGEDMRDGFKLAVEQGKGSLGGIPVELLVDDDAGDPQKGKQIAERMIKSDKIDMMTGIMFSNVAMAVVPSVLKDGLFFVGANAAPAPFAGKMCNPNYFNVAYQNDNMHEAMGEYLTQQGYKSVFLIAPNYPAGKDALTGFKRFYKGEVKQEVYTKLDQSDYAALISQIRADKPDAVFYFLPGGLGVNFLKQYDQAGMKSEVKIFGPGFSFDRRLLGAVGAAAEGVMNSSEWNDDLPAAGNAEFVQAFHTAYGRYPTLYAAQAYDAANLIGSALKQVDGKLDDKDAVRKALMAADFSSVRGSFRFNTNHHPIQDIYVRQVIKLDDGSYANKTVSKVFEQHQDAYVSECKL